MSDSMKRLATAFVLVLVLVLVAAPAHALGPEPGDRAPVLDVKDWVNGGPLNLPECEGSVVAVLFFATTAPDMGKYAKSYVNFVNSYGPRGLKVMGISRESKDHILNWADEQQLNFPLAVDDGAWKGPWGVEGYPFVFIVDIYGEIAWRGDGNRVEQVAPQIETCLKEVKRVTVKREDTGKSFDKVWRALDKNEYPNAIKFCESLLKSKDEEDRKDAEAILKDLGAIADARLKRVGELEKRKDYVSGEAILRSVERLFVGLPQSKTAKELREKWLKTAVIKNELDAQRCLEQGRAFETAKHYKKAADMYRAAMGFPGTRAAAKANAHLAEMIKTGWVKG